MRLRAVIAHLDDVLESRIINLVGSQLVQRPGSRERRKDETVESGIDTGRHRHLDCLDAAASVVRQMFRSERFTKCLDAALLDHSLARVSLKLVERRQLRLRTSLTHPDPPPQNLRKLTFDLGAGPWRKSKILLTLPPPPRGGYPTGHPSAPTVCLARPPCSMRCSSTS